MLRPHSAECESQVIAFLNDLQFKQEHCPGQRLLFISTGFMVMIVPEVEIENFKAAKIPGKLVGYWEDGQVIMEDDNGTIL